jgi:hypothetical protein
MLSEWKRKLTFKQPSHRSAGFVQGAEPGPEVVDRPALPFSSGSQPHGDLVAGRSNAPAAGASLQGSRVEAPGVPGDQPIAEDVLSPASAFAAEVVAAPTPSAYPPSRLNKPHAAEAPDLPLASLPEVNVQRDAILAAGRGAPMLRVYIDRRPASNGAGPSTPLLAGGGPLRKGMPSAAALERPEQRAGFPCPRGPQATLTDASHGPLFRFSAGSQLVSSGQGRKAQQRESANPPPSEHLRQGGASRGVSEAGSLSNGAGPHVVPRSQSFSSSGPRPLRPVASTEELQLRCGVSEQRQGGGGVRQTAFPAPSRGSHRVGQPMGPQARQSGPPSQHLSMEKGPSGLPHTGASGPIAHAMRCQRTPLHEEIVLFADQCALEPEGAQAAEQVREDGCSFTSISQHLHPFFCLATRNCR